VQWEKGTVPASLLDPGAGFAGIYMVMRHRKTLERNARVVEVVFSLPLSPTTPPPPPNEALMSYLLFAACCKRTPRTIGSIGTIGRLVNARFGMPVSASATTDARMRRSGRHDNMEIEPAKPKC